MNARHIDTATDRIVSLQAEEMARIRGGARLHVQRGLLWLTVDGKPDDHMLRAGEGITLGRGARGLMQALYRPADIVVAAPAPSWPQRTIAALHAATRRFQAVRP